MNLSMLSLAIVPAILALVGIYALVKKCDVWNALLDGATDGAKLLLRILPSLIALLTGVYMLRASGAMDIITNMLSPFTKLLGIPAECAPMGILRPFSGSAALAAGSEIIKSCGADSYVGRIAAVMLGSAETTFYTIAVYFGAIGVNKTRYAIPAALIADIAGYAASTLAVRLFFGG